MLSQEFDLFTDNPYVYNVTHAEQVIVHPVLKTNDLISFQIPPSQRSFTKNEFILRTEWHLMNGDEQLANDDQVSVLAYIHDAMFKQVSVQFAETTVYDSPSLGYALSSYLSNRFTYSDSARTTQSELLMGYPDTPGAMEDFSPDTKENVGYWKRLHAVAHSSKVTTQGSLMIPICQSGKSLPPGLPVTINLFKAADGVILLSPVGIGKQYRLVIDSIQLEITRYRLTDELVTKIYDVWRERRFISYEYERLQPVGPFELTQGQTLLNKIVSVGQQPRFCLAVFISSASANGAMDRNLFTFHHLRANKLQMSFESDHYPSEPYTPRFPAIEGEETKITREYAAFMQTIGLLNQNVGNGLSTSGWRWGNTVFAFALNSQPRTGPGILTPKPDSGYLKISVSLDAPVFENYQLWVFPVYSSRMTISPQLIVQLDYAAGAPS